MGAVCLWENIYFVFLFKSSSPAVPESESELHVLRSLVCFLLPPRDLGVSLAPLPLTSQIGTNQMAVCAKAQNKPFYVVAESFKFVRLFPLNQQDVPDQFKARALRVWRSTESKPKPLEKC